ncbi:hypothetical protein LVD15_17290 [Fulvivirga maritima]|uniref:hypothetical protein n=1 Tax=Fulvivirga maritima TaxID=2904247 RepID=UPI001F161096|nr:hypothetical protein [Fulvivirga maritima]UII25055.1 hypothetical protein LVD15_17290 [Fulvivirga maritima]
MAAYTKEKVNEEMYKITKSGTFTKEDKDIILSKSFRKIVTSLKPVELLNR